MALPETDRSHDTLPAPERPWSYHLSLSVYWLSNALLWGALLHLGLQSRLSDWFGEAHVGYYMGLLGAAGGFIAAVTQIVAGAFSDCCRHRWGRRRPFLLVGTLFGLGSLLGLGLARSFWPFATAFLLLELFLNMALGPFAALLPDTVHPREHGKTSGLLGVARLVGDIGGLILAAQLLSVASLQGQPPEAILSFHHRRFALMCVLIAAFIFATMLFSLFFIVEEPLLHTPQALSPSQIIRRSFAIDVRRYPDFCWLTLSRGITNLGFYMFLQVLYFFLRYTLNVPDPEKASMNLMLPAIAMATLSSLPAGLLSDRLGRRRPIVFAAQFLLAGAGLIFALAPNTLFGYIAGVPAGLAFGIFTTVEWALACNLLPRGEAARYLGFWNASAVVPQILAFPLAGVIGSRLSAIVPGLGWRVVFGVSVLCCLIGAWLLLYVRERPLLLRPSEAGKAATAGE